MCVCVCYTYIHMYNYLYIYNIHCIHHTQLAAPLSSKVNRKNNDNNNNNIKPQRAGIKNYRTAIYRCTIYIG